MNKTNETLFGELLTTLQRSESLASTAAFAEALEAWVAAELRAFPEPLRAALRDASIARPVSSYPTELAALDPRTELAALRRIGPLDRAGIAQWIGGILLRATTIELAPACLRCQGGPVRLFARIADEQPFGECDACLSIVIAGGGSLAPSPGEAIRPTRALLATPRWEHVRTTRRLD